MLDTHFWRKYFEVYDVLNELIPYQELSEKIIDSLDIKEGDTVLDLGSGTGNIAVKAESRGARVTGIDFSTEGTAIHQAKSSRSEVLVGDITAELPFPDECFDKVYSNNVLYTIPEEKRGALFKELYRVMKKDGVIVIANPKVGFKPFLIYTDHIQKQRQQEGLYRTIKKMTHYVIPTMQIFYYNARIRRAGQNGQYRFMKKNDQKHYLAQAGFRSVSDNMLVYGRQSILNTARK